jgi:alcohol dehydrogenase
VQESDLGQIARLSLNSKRLIDNNPVPLDLESVTAIVHAAYTGDRTIR